jgi:hypothetical protein
MVYALIAPFIICVVILLGTTCGIIAYRIRRKALNPPPTLEQQIEDAEKALRIGKYMEG